LDRTRFGGVTRGLVLPEDWCYPRTGGTRYYGTVFVSALIFNLCRLTRYLVSTPEGVRPKVSNQGGSIDYLLIATLSLRAKREGSYVRIASSVQAILSRSCAVN
jgi:hypothetical protein